MKDKALTKAEKKDKARKIYASLFADPSVTELASEVGLLERAISNGESTFEKVMLYRAVLALEAIADGVVSLAQDSPELPPHWVVRSPFGQDS